MQHWLLSVTQHICLVFFSSYWVGNIMALWCKVYPTTIGSSLFSILEEKSGEKIPGWIGSGWLLHTVFKALHPYCLSFSRLHGAGTGSHHVLYLIWWKQSHAHSVICIRFVRLSHLVSILVERRLRSCKPHVFLLLLLLSCNSFITVLLWPCSSAHFPTHSTLLL